MINYNTSKKFAVQEFDTELNLGISNKPFHWTESKISWFDNGEQALIYFIKHAPATAELLKDEPDNPIHQQIIENRRKYKDDNWVNINRL